MDSIIKQLAKEYDLPPFVIESIVRSEFKFVKDCMETDECVKIRLHHFGVFKVKPKRLYIINGETERT
tara:strand:- start:948 stop:1151 length:204 start_codon:yes stop_codon:yes gene_type:complete